MNIPAIISMLFFTFVVYKAKGDKVIEVTPIPKSCLDHLKAGKEKNGYYAIAGHHGEQITVYCDFTSEPGSAWTLFMSWALKHRKIAAFGRKAFTQDAPFNHRSPNWIAYRLPKKHITSIRSQSSHWRSTCSFDFFGVDYDDYVRGSLDDFDITAAFTNGICKKVEYINIRGHVGNDLTVQFFQGDNHESFHIDSDMVACQFNATVNSVYSEDNFGLYLYINRNFRCSNNQRATTQYWFGSYL